MDRSNRTRTATDPSIGEGSAGRRRSITPDLGVALLLRLQRVLEPESLLETLVAELKRIVPAVQVSLRHGAVSLRCGDEMARGKGTVHRLRVEGEEVGAVTVRGSRSFTQRERDLMGVVLMWFDYPLHNALQQQALQRQARCDPLTGLLNRNTLPEVLEREVGLARRHGEIFSLIILDIDDFKTINDKFGHAAGDSVLRQLSVILHRCTRRTDLLFRFAGDEFLLGSSHTDRAGATTTAERILAAVAATRFRHTGDVLLPIRVSMGIADLRIGESAESLFERADGALFSAKRGGRNRIEVASAAS